MNFHLMLGEKKMKNSFKTIFSAPLALIVNLLLIYVSFSLCRLLFIWVNHNYFTDLTFSHFWEMFRGGLVFDTSAILYTVRKIPVLVLESVMINIFSRIGKLIMPGISFIKRDFR